MTISHTYNQIYSSYCIKITLFHSLIHSRTLTSGFGTSLENFQKGAPRKPTLALQFDLATALTFNSTFRPPLSLLASSAPFPQKEQVSLVVFHFQNLLYGIRFPWKSSLASFAIFLFSIKLSSFYSLKYFYEVCSPSNLFFTL